MRSSMNQPLEADIELQSADDIPLNLIRVGLADIKDFQRVGVRYMPKMKRLKFRVSGRPSDKPVIRVSSDSPIEESFLNFLLEVNWPNGKLLREYTALLDLPTTTAQKAPKIEASTGQIKPAPVQATPAVVNAGRRVTRTDEYGPIKAKETLWSIAGKIRPDGISIKQMMAALQRANPQAFIGGNMNRLRKGQILRVPDINAIRKISPAQAEQIFRQQLKQFSFFKRQVVAARIKAPQLDKTSSNQADKSSQSAQGSPNQQAQNVVEQLNQAQDRLQIATPRPDAKGKAGASEGRGDIQSDYQLTEQLMRAREDVETARQESNILRSEIDDLQSRLSDMQRLLTLKDEQLARLQDSVQQQVQQKVPVPTHGSPVASQPTLPAENDPALINPDTAVAVAPIEPAQPIQTTPANQSDTVSGAGQSSPQAESPQVASKDKQHAWLAKAQHWLGEARNLTLDTWQQLARQPVYLATLGGALLLLLIGLIVRRKRNERMVEEIADPFDAAYDAPLDTAFDMPMDENDPINQADLHIAYGRFQQAEDVLKDAQQKFPGRSDILNKLLQVYHATHNVAAFNGLAQQLMRQNQPVNDPTAWAEVTAMGTELDPDNPLFQADTYDAGSLAQPSHSQASGTNEVAFALDNEPSIGQVETRFEPTGTKMPEIPTLTLDQPLDIEQAYQHVINENNPVSQAESENEEVKNKIDLARVYIDMGDADGARDILQEVRSEGSQRQKNQAAELLAQIA